MAMALLRAKQMLLGPGVGSSEEVLMVADAAGGMREVGTGALILKLDESPEHQELCGRVARMEDQMVERVMLTIIEKLEALSRTGLKTLMIDGPADGLDLTVVDFPLGIALRDICRSLRDSQAWPSFRTLIEQRDVASEAAEELRKSLERQQPAFDLLNATVANLKTFIMDFPMEDMTEPLSPPEELRVDAWLKQREQALNDTAGKRFMDRMKELKDIAVAAQLMDDRGNLI